MAILLGQSFFIKSRDEQAPVMIALLQIFSTPELNQAIEGNQKDDLQIIYT